MALKDLLRRNKPTDPNPSTPPTQARGRSGRGHTQGFIVPDELNADLVGAEGLRIFDYMWRSDGTVRRTVQMLISPIAGATWEVLPYGDDEAQDSDLKAAEFITWMLFEHMRPRLPSHLFTALRRCARSGFTPFEQVWELTEWDGKPVYALRTLGFKLPRTIHKFDDDGVDLTSITQYPDLGSPVTYPAEDLVYYRFGAEGDNWEGEAILRPAYKAWYAKEGLEKIDLIGHEHERIGTPFVFPPSSVIDDDQLDAVEDAIANMQANETPYVIMPGPDAEALTGEQALQGWTVKDPMAAGRTSKGSDLVASLQHHKDEIAAAMIEEFMRLGQGGVGARATADVQQDPFLAFCELLASTVVEDTWNEGPIPRALELNGFDPKRPPRLKCSLIDSTSLTELATVMASLITAGVIHTDNDLEDWTRKYADLPPVDPQARQEREQQEAEMAQATMDGLKAKNDAVAAGKPVDQPPGDQPPDKKLALDDEGMRLARRRDSRPWEDSMCLDQIEGALSGARDQFEQACQQTAYQLASDLAERAANNRKTDPKPPDSPPAELVDALTTELDALYATGRQTVRSELASQSVAPPLLLDGQSRDLTGMARLAATAIVQAIWQAVTRQGLTSKDRGQLQAAGELAARGAVRQEAQQNAAAAVNLGRSDEADQNMDVIAGARYTSILDPNRCPDCQQADDDVLRPLTDPVRLSHKPPNPQCAGGRRCRCMEFFQLKTETAPTV